MSRHIVVNCQKVPFEVTLGVAGYLLNLCTALSKNNKITFAVNDPAKLPHTPAYPIISAMNADIVSLEKARKSGAYRNGSAIELLPHHFQESLLCEKSVIICHDLHIYDVPWKYKDVETIRAAFKANLTNASAVMTEFPRTYYDLESIAGITLMHLYLTETPLLLDTRPDKFDGTETHSGKNDFFLYPAQLQLHKNHEGLIRGLRLLKDKGVHTSIVCPGSDFDEAITSSLKSLACELGVEDMISFPGRVSDEELKQYYRDCAGVIIPSKAEGGAYVAFEGIAAGKPVAIHDIKAARLHLKMIGADVIWFNSDDHQSTADAIEQLMDIDTADWKIRNTVARERISTMTWDRVAAQFQKVFDWLAGEAEDRPIMRMRQDSWSIETA